MKSFGKAYYPRGFLKLIVPMSTPGRKAIIFECRIFSTVNYQITFFILRFPKFYFYPCSCLGPSMVLSVKKPTDLVIFDQK